MVRDLTNERHVLTFFRVEHGFSYCGNYFFLVKSDNSAVSFNNSLNHDSLRCFVEFVSSAKIPLLFICCLFWKTFI